MKDFPRVQDITDKVRYSSINKRNRLFYISYSSMTDLMKVLEECKENTFNQGVIKDTIDDTGYPIRDDWYGRGCKYFHQVIKKINEPWKEGTDKINERSKNIIASLSARVKREKRAMCFSDQGDEVVTQAVLSGNLDTAWRAKKRVQRKQVFNKAEIILQPGGNVFVTSDELFNQTACALALSSFLNKKRVHTKIIATDYANQVARRTRRSPRNVDTIIFVTLKRYNYKLNTEQIAINTWSGVFRTLYFLARQNIPAYVCPGLGWTKDVAKYPNILPPLKRQDIKRFIVPQVRTISQGKSFIESLIKKGEL